MLDLLYPHYPHGLFWQSAVRRAVRRCRRISYCGGFAADLPHGLAPIYGPPAKPALFANDTSSPVFEGAEPRELVAQVLRSA